MTILNRLLVGLLAGVAIANAATAKEPTPNCADDPAGLAPCGPLKGCLSDGTRFEGFVRGVGEGYARFRVETGAACSATFSWPTYDQAAVFGTCMTRSGREIAFEGVYGFGPDGDQIVEIAVFEASVFLAQSDAREAAAPEAVRAWIAVGLYPTTDLDTLGYPDHCAPPVS